MTKRVAIWCDYCNAHINVSGVLSCLRKTCETKAKVPPEAKRRLVK